MFAGLGLRDGALQWSGCVFWMTGVLSVGSRWESFCVNTASHCWVCMHTQAHAVHS